jgi:hypothetical protein
MSQIEFLLPGKRDVMRKSKNARTRADFARMITEAWQSTMQGVYRTGMMLETAKAELPHGEWEEMVRNDLPFARDKAFRLIAIATDDRLQDVAHALHLPVSWMTQYELTKLDDDTFAAAIADGRINPKMQRKDALALRPKRPRRASNPSPKPSNDPKPSSNPIPAIDRCAMHVRSIVLDMTNEIDPDQWPALIDELRGEIDDIERTLAARRKEEDN